MTASNDTAQRRPKLSVLPYTASTLFACSITRSECRASMIEVPAAIAERTLTQPAKATSSSDSTSRP